MRRAAVIMGILVLTVAFAAAWFTLGPTAAEHRAPDIDEKSIGDLHCGSPLQAGDRGDSNGNNPAETNSGDPGATGNRDNKTDDSKPDPSGARSSAESRSGETTAGGTPTTRTAGDAPAPPPGETATGEAPVPPTPQPFIKGHTHPPGQNLGNTRPGARVIGKPTGVKELSDVTPKLMQDRRGLYAQYFGMSDSNLAELDTSSPDMVRIDREIYFLDAEAFSDLPFSLENFAATWEGFLVIPEQGDYWLFWGADNGGRVELDGETVLLQEGMVRYVEVSAVLTLQPGLHPLRIEFAQTHNAVADWAKCAANFMWVPEGQTKPVPVPPEMLMVPEWMWSDNAPIITSLSKYEGEIGDEIEIVGQALAYTKSEIPNVSYKIRVLFRGQQAEVLVETDSVLQVRVPLGADTGDVIVMQDRITRVPDSEPEDGDDGWTEVVSTTPSNGIRFSVTTEFGLTAHWHNLQGWDNFSFIEPGMHEPDTIRAEREFMFVSKDHLNLEFKNGPLACAWTGFIGVPSDKGWKDLWVLAACDLRVTVKGEVWTSAPTFRANGKLDTLAHVALDAQTLAGTKSSITIEIAAEGLASLIVVAESPRSSTTPLIWTTPISDIPSDVAPAQWFFPPTRPHWPPEIRNVKPVWAEGEQPTSLPFDADASRPSIRAGQEFTFELLDLGPLHLVKEDLAILVSIDDIPISYSVEDVSEATWGRDQKCRAVMPVGVGNGCMVARQSLAVSEPFLIDIANRGLVAYLYDVPEGAGLAKLPDLAPLDCFKVRKDRVINFETAASFDLPFPAETFVIEWLGGLIIEEEGDYTFTCRSDDGMKLWLDDNVVLDADKLQAPAENSATLHLVPGTYRFRMQFFENNQHEVCVLEWAATRGEGSALETVIPRAVIPAKAFTLDVHPPFPAKTSTGKRTDGS